MLSQNGDPEEEEEEKWCVGGQGGGGVRGACEEGCQKSWCGSCGCTTSLKSVV